MPPAPPDPRTTAHAFQEDEEDDLCHVCRGRADDPIHRADRLPPRRPTLKETILAGPRWNPMRATSSVHLAACSCCGDLVEYRDHATDMCKVCWRIWRWASAGFPARAPCWPD